MPGFPLNYQKANDRIAARCGEGMRFIMNIVVRRYLDRSRLAQGLLEDWQIEHKEAMFATDVEELVEECSSSSTPPRRRII